MSAYIKIRNLHKSYPSQDGMLTVLEGLNLDIGAGEFISIIGPTGCGKSTLLQLVAGFIEPDEGNILRYSKPVKGPSPDRIMVFQSFEQLFPWKTVLGNICFTLNARDIGGSRPERQQKARDYLQMVDLEGFADYYPHQLSGGMKQRAVLARALAAEPEMLLMDEPFGSLDSLTRQELQQLLLSVWRQSSITVVFVTHDIREAIILADRIVILDKDKGRIGEIRKNVLPHPRKDSEPEFIKLYNALRKEL